MEVTDAEKAGLFEQLCQLGVEKWNEMQSWVKAELETYEQPPAPSEKFVRSRGSRWQAYDEQMPCPQLPVPTTVRLNPKSGNFETLPAPPRDSWVKVRLLHESFVCISKAQSDNDAMRGFADVIADAIRGKDLGATAPQANIGERVVASSEIVSVNYQGTIYFPNAKGQFLLPSSYVSSVATYQTSPVTHLGASGRTRVEFVEPEAKAA